MTRIKSSIRDLEEFKEGFIWADIVAYLNDWRMGLADEIVDLDGPDLYRCQGNLKGVDYFKEIIDTMIADLKFDASKEKENVDRSNSTDRSGDGE